MPYRFSWRILDGASEASRLGIAVGRALILVLATANVAAWGFYAVLELV